MLKIAKILSGKTNFFRDSQIEGIKIGNSNYFWGAHRSLAKAILMLGNNPRGKNGKEIWVLTQNRNSSIVVYKGAMNSYF